MIFAPWIVEFLPAGAWPRLVDDPSFRELDPVARQEVMVAALRPTRRVLWENAVPIESRERIVAMSRQRELPLERRRVIHMSWLLTCSHLAVLHGGEDAELFAQCSTENGCLDRPYPFASAHSRFYYLQRGGSDPAYAAHEEFRSRAIVMSGLPGAGKDTWIRENADGWPVVSLDQIRNNLGVAPTDDQGRVVQAAREAARVYLRAGTNFVWNATNITRRIRRGVIGLLADYDAHIRIVHVEVEPDVLWDRNRRRPDGLPEKAMSSLIDRWEVPAQTEAHVVEWV